MVRHNLAKGLMTGLLTCIALTIARPLQADEPFDYFANSWSVIGLEDYNRGTRITPQNELVIGGDGNGQTIWALWQFYKIAGDREWLMKAYPQMRRAADWTMTTRRQAHSESPFFGLLPNAPADGEYLRDGKCHIVGCDFWNLRGLLCTADAAQQPGLYDIGGFCRTLSSGRPHQAKCAGVRWSTGLWNPLIETGPPKGGRSSCRLAIEPHVEIGTWN